MKETTPLYGKTVVPRQTVGMDAFGISNHELVVLREDRIHPTVSGNKFRKLVYNLQRAEKEGYTTLVTFGGAYSNHIAAVAAVGEELGFDTLGIIRGEELARTADLNPTLQFASDCGMKLHYVSRKDFRKKEDLEFVRQLTSDAGKAYLLPEGGTNALAVLGCTEILSEEDKAHDYVCVPVGTGGTISGIVRSSGPLQHVIGYSALKGVFQKKEIQKYTPKGNFELTDAYCFGGYAKIGETLIRFINDFKQKTGIPLDPVYTGKMMYGIIDGMKNGFFKENSRIFAIHTGGLQGIAGMNELLKRKNLPLLHE